VTYNLIHLSLFISQCNVKHSSRYGSLYHTSQNTRANRQLGKVTQWTNEKVFSGEKTQLSSEFTQFERDIEIKKNGIER
jgi:hypothetical protein